MEEVDVPCVRRLTIAQAARTRAVRNIPARDVGYAMHFAIDLAYGRKQAVGFSFAPTVSRGTWGVAPADGKGCCVDERVLSLYPL